jgi:hypothetical protein
MTNKYNKLRSLGSLLREKNLSVEARLVNRLYDELYKVAAEAPDAGLKPLPITPAYFTPANDYDMYDYDYENSSDTSIDKDKSLFLEMIDNPEVIENISLAIKLAALISAAAGASTGVGAAAGAGTAFALTRISSAADLAAAAGYYKNNQIRECLMNILSAVIVCPSSWISKVTSFLLSQTAIKIIVKYKVLKRNSQTAFLVAKGIVQTIEKSIPIVLDGLIKILNEILEGISFFAEAIASKTGVPASKVSKDIEGEIKVLSAGIAAISAEIKSS